MKYLSQFCIILGFTFAGEALQRLIPLPIPASVWGLALLFAALCTGIVKPAQVKEVSAFLISIMGKGKTYMSSSAGLDAEIASVITGLILLFSACGAFIRYLVKRSKENIAETEKANKAEVDK